MNNKSDYNGWKNRQTWNVALWINNDECLYSRACAFVQKRKDVKNTYPLYIRFICSMGMTGERNRDNISWTGTRLDYKALNEMMRELIV